MIPGMSVTKKTLNLCCFVKSEQHQHLHAAVALAYLSSLKSILIFRFVSTSVDDQTIPSFRCCSCEKHFLGGGALPKLLGTARRRG